jgi:hypothetical protein
LASVVDICNLSLGHLGNSANVSAISPPDGSVEAMHCARFYPIARKALLEQHPWAFSTKRIALIEIVTDEKPDTWAFAYAIPNGMIRPIRVTHPLAADDEDGEDFKYETLSDGTPVIYTNAEDAVLVYCVDTTDTTKFPGLFVLCLSRLLASFLAGPLLKGTTGAKVAIEQYKIFLREYGQAAAVDANARKSNPSTEHTPASMAARA